MLPNIAAKHWRRDAGSKHANRFQLARLHTCGLDLALLSHVGKGRDRDDVAIRIADWRRRHRERAAVSSRRYSIPSR